MGPVVLRVRWEKSEGFLFGILAVSGEVGWICWMDELLLEQCFVARCCDVVLSRGCFIE